MCKKRNTIAAIVDDNAIVRFSVRYQLLSKDFQVGFEAENGKVCIERMSELLVKPDIIILDLEMPVMDGFQTAVVLKQAWPEVIIIAYSGKDDAESIGLSLQAGADHFVSKHSEPEELVALVKQIHTERVSAQNDLKLCSETGWD